MYEINNQLFHWVDNPVDSIDRIHLIIDYLPPEYNVPESLTPNFKFHIKKHRVNRPPCPSDLDIKLPKLVASVSGKHDGAQLVVVDFENDQVQIKKANYKKVLTDEIEGPIPERLTGLKRIDGTLVATTGEALLFFDKKFNVVGHYSNQYLSQGGDIFLSDKSIYVASPDFDSILHFDLKRKKFDRGWKFIPGSDSGNIKVMEFHPMEDGSITPSCHFGVNSAGVIGQILVILGSRMDRTLHYCNGNTQLVDQVPLGSSNLNPYGKGIIFRDSQMNRVIYTANYDYREVDLFEQMVTEKPELTAEQSIQTGGLCKYLSGTVFVSVGSSVCLVDMKNQSIIKSMEINSEDGTIIDGLALWQKS